MKFGVINPVDDITEYDICNIKVSVYYYIIVDKNEKFKYTPFQKNVIDIASYEGIYHPVCKLSDYPELTITEEEVIKNGTVLFTFKSKNTEALNVPMLVAMIVCGLHALTVRLSVDVKRISKGYTIDAGHLKAPTVTIKFVEYYIKILKTKTSFDYFSCIIHSLSNNFIQKEKLLGYYALMKEYSKNKSKTVKEKILANYYPKGIKKQLF